MFVALSKEIGAGGVAGSQRRLDRRATEKVLSRPASIRSYAMQLFARRVLSSLLFAAIVAAPAAARDKDKGDARAPLFEAVVQCRAIADQTQRLACYDSAVAALDQAEQTHNIVVMDKSQVRETRRSLFGFSLPKIHLFGAGDDEEVTKIDAVVASTTRDQDNRMIFTIDGGARWHQIDDRTVVGVKRGVKVTIKEAAFGSYFADFPHGAMRVRREN
jgi:hypothetical protein